MVAPEPGTTYTFLITSRWHDSSVDEVVAEYVVERVEDRDDKSTLVKLVDSADDSDFYWILDRSSDAIYESNDPFIDAADLMLIAAPVREDEGWTFGTGSYQIQKLRLTSSNEVGDAHDVVEVDAQFSDIDGMDLEYEWSPDYGLYHYRELYDSDSYLSIYTRELTGVSVPE